MSEAFEQAVRLLARREHSRFELQQKLTRKGFDDADIDEALDRCEQLGYQSDVRFVGQFCQYRFNQGDGPLKIRHALQQKGIAKTLTHDCLDAFDWPEQAKTVFNKKFSRPCDQSNEPKLRQKQIRFMQSRGFDLGLIKQCFPR